MKKTIDHCSQWLTNKCEFCTMTSFYVNLHFLHNPSLTISMKYLRQFHKNGIKMHKN